MDMYYVMCSVYGVGGQRGMRMLLLIALLQVSAGYPLKWITDEQRTAYNRL